MANPLTRLYRACDPLESLRPDDERYVNLDDVRGENLALEYARGFRLADPDKSEVRVFAGHRGVGKTSELLRLEGLLEEPRGGGRPFLVIFADVTDKLDLNDIDFPDLLVFLAGEVQRQLREAEIPGFGGASQSIQRLWDDLKGLLGKEVDLTTIEADVPYAGLTLELRNRPNARDELRRAIERQSTSLIAAVNDLLGLATVRLRESGREGLVLIVDGLDKVHRRKFEDGSNTHERLFIHRGEQLASIETHVVYTVPISLIYAPRVCPGGADLRRLPGACSDDQAKGPGGRGGAGGYRQAARDDRAPLPVR